MSDSKMVQSVSDKLKELQLSKKAVKYVKEVEVGFIKFNEAFNEMTKCVTEHFNGGRGISQFIGEGKYDADNLYQNGYVASECYEKAKAVRESSTVKIYNTPEDIQGYVTNNSELTETLKSIYRTAAENYANQKLFCFTEAAKIVQKAALDIKLDISSLLNGGSSQDEDNSAELALLAIKRCEAVFFEDSTFNDEKIEEIIQSALDGNLNFGGEVVELPAFA